MPTPCGADPGRGQAEPHSLQETQRRAVKQEMSQEVAGKRWQRKKGKGMPRFSIDQENPPLGPEDDAQERFHWDPLRARCYPSTTPDNGLGDPARVSVNREPVPLGGNCSKRRKRQLDDGLFDMGQTGKKRKAKSNKGTEKVDQLLAVSLQEEEVCKSLQELDHSLMAARTALQAAYTEVQRLLVLRQQFTTEVNGLRAKRIQILQGMQDSPGPCSAAAPTSTLPPSHSPHPTGLSLPVPSPLSQPSATAPSSSSSSPVGHLLPASTPPAPRALLKQEPGGRPEAAPLAPGNPRPSSIQPTLLPLTTPPTTASATNTPLPPPPPQPPADVKVRNSPKSNVEETVLPPAPKREEEEEAADSYDSDGSLVLMEPPTHDVIHIDESDGEVAPKKVPDHHRENPAPLEPTPTSTRAALPNTASVSEPAKVPEQEQLALGSFQNHTGPVHDLQIYGGRLYTCSGDSTARAYCLVSKECQAVFEGHSSNVNCLLVASSGLDTMARLYTGSSDKTVRCYSIKSKKCLDQISFPDRVLCLHIAWGILYVGLSNGSVVSLDLKVRWWDGSLLKDTTGRCIHHIS